MNKLLVFLVLLILFRVDIPPSPETPVEYKVYIPLFFYSGPTLGVQDQCEGCYSEYYAVRSLVYIPFRLDRYEAGLIDLDRIKTISQTHHVILGIRTFPEWVRLYPEKECSPPASLFYEILVHKITYILNYTGARGVALANETNVQDDSLPFIGCFDSVFQYADFVRYFYDGIKRYLPNMEVLIGELAGCPSEFVDSLLHSVDGKYDALSFHVYSYYGGSKEEIITCANLLRNKLPSDKKLYLTETALLYYGDCSNPDFQSAQIDHFKYMESIIYMGIVDRAYWYTIDRNGPWKCSALTSDGTATPVYEYYRVALGTP